MPGLPLLEFAGRLNGIIPGIIKEFARRQANELYKGKITLPQFLLLDFLNAKGEAKMKDLARFMQVSTAAITGMVDRLVKYNYLKRIFDPGDRRIIKVGLTSKGAELVRKVRLKRRKMIIHIFGRLTQQERQNYLNVLMRIQDIFRKEKEAKL